MFKMINTFVQHRPNEQKCIFTVGDVKGTLRICLHYDQLESENCSFVLDHQNIDLAEERTYLNTLVPLVTFPMEMSFFSLYYLLGEMFHGVSFFFFKDLKKSSA